MTKLFLYYACGVVLLAGAGLAQTAAPESRDSQGVQLLTEALYRLGGAERLSIADARVEGVILSPTTGRQVGTFVGKVRSDDFSMETHRDGVITSYRVLGGRGTIKVGGKLRHLQEYNTAGQGFDFVPLLGRWSGFVNERATVSAPDPVTPSEGLYRIRVDLKSASDRRNQHDLIDVFFDATSRLVVATRYTATQGPYLSDQVSVETQYDAYEQRSGIMVPTRIVRLIAGKPVLVLVVQSFQINVGFSDGDFQN